MVENLRETLGRHAFAFKKRYGQNFLTDPNLLDAIAKDAGADGRTVLEIGAGAGALTRALASRAERVVAYEIDRDLQPVLAETRAGCENAEVVFRDFLREDLGEIEREIGEYIVVANLPYYITTPVVMRFVEEAKLCRGCTFMVQEEVAARFTARENTPEYGAVTAAIALRGRAHLLRKVPRTMFTPQPNVDSAVVTVAFGEDPVSVKDARAYRDTVRIAFAGRRKTLENNLVSALSLPRAAAKEILAEAGVKEGVRGETLPPEAFAALADVLFERRLLPRKKQ